MPLPPKGDPSRPVAIAARIMNVLGWLFVGFSVLAVATVTLIASRVQGPQPVPVTFAAILAALIYGLPGALYLVFAFHLKRGALWATMAGLILGSIHAALVALALLMQLRSSSLLGLLFVGLVLAALIQLILNLIAARKFLKGGGFGRGFEPIMPEATPLTLTPPPPTLDEPR